MLQTGDCSAQVLARTLRGDTPLAAQLWRLQAAGVLAQGWTVRGSQTLLWREPEPALLPALGPLPRGAQLRAAAELLWRHEEAAVWCSQPGAGWRLRGSLFDNWPRWMALPAASADAWKRRLGRLGLPGADALDWLLQARLVVPVDPTLGRAIDLQWPLHARLMQLASRRGLGRQPGRQPNTQPPAPSPIQGGGTPLSWPALAPAENSGLVGWQSLVAQRRSQRRHAPDGLPLARLGAWLEAVFGSTKGRRAYGSGGALYALRPFVVAHAVAELSRGVWHVNEDARNLVPLAGDLMACERLLRDAAASGDVTRLPSVLVVLAADLPRVQAAYGDLAHSLLLKEAGAVLEAAQLAAAALGLACCPMGTGDAEAFEAASGLSRARWPSLAELTLGMPEC